MRILVVYAVVIILCAYAWRNWVFSLFALIVLTAIHEHEDMPRFLFGIRGLNLWNALFLTTFLAWLVDRVTSRRPLGFPKPFRVLMVAYLAVVFVGVLRGAMDVSSYARPIAPMRMGEFLSDNLINAIKYSLPALLLFDACRTRKRVVAAFLCIGALVAIDALLVIKRIPLSTLFGATDTWVLRRRVSQVTGQHPNDMALMLVIGFWSVVGFLPVLRRWLRVGGVGVAGVCALALGLCYSRAGFVACLGVGLLLGLFGSKRILLVLLGVVIPLGLASPSVRARFSVGLTETSADSIGAEDDDVVTAGRSKYIWPIVISGISRSPAIGHGRHAANRVLVEEFLDKYEGLPGHPHNAYLEILLDLGLVGLVPVLGLFGYLLQASIRMVRYRGDPLVRAVGNAGLAGVGTLMLMGMSGQHFYPSVNLFVFCCVEAVVLRVYADTFLRRRVELTAPRRSF